MNWYQALPFRFLFLPGRWESLARVVEKHGRILEIAISLAKGVSNRWTGIWNGMVEWNGIWNMEWTLETIVSGFPAPAVHSMQYGIVLHK